MARTLKPIEHGTYAGWNAHRYRDIPMCDGCREAQRLYVSRRRALSARVRAEESRLNTAHARAKTRAAHWVQEHYPEVWAKCQQESA